MQVSRREELRDHDRIVVGRVYREVRDATPASGPLSADNHKNLLDLAALEPELDRLLLDPAPAKALAYKEPIGRPARPPLGRLGKDLSPSPLSRRRKGG